MAEGLLIAAGLVIGACIGSFLGAASWRLPRGQSLISPPSSCPNCSRKIGPWQLVPIVSWLWQRGRARCCGARLSLHYLLLELGGATLGAMAAGLAL